LGAVVICFALYLLLTWGVILATSGGKCMQFNFLGDGGSGSSTFSCSVPQLLFQGFGIPFIFAIFLWPFSLLVLAFIFAIGFIIKYARDRISSEKAQG
jgi:hypothetical protein